MELAGGAQPLPPGGAPQPPPQQQQQPSAVSDAVIASQATMRTARLTGGIASLPTLAWSQGFAAPALSAMSSAVRPADVTVHVGRDAAVGDAAVGDAAVGDAAVGSPSSPAVHEVETGTMPAPGAGCATHPNPWLLPCRRRTSKSAEAALAASREYRVDEHRLTLAQLATRFATHVDPSAPERSRGLSRAEAATRLRAYGPNRLTPPPELPELYKFAAQFSNILIVMLIVAASLAFLGWGLATDDDANVILAGVLSVVVVLTCMINYWHERATSNVLASIKDMLPTTCTVVRDGHEFTLPAEQVRARRGACSTHARATARAHDCRLSWRQGGSVTGVSPSSASVRAWLH